MTDELSTLYSDLLEGSYDCVDRIILNVYFPMGINGGGMRCWWRTLHGSDENLDNAYGEGLRHHHAYFPPAARNAPKPSSVHS